MLLWLSWMPRFRVNCVAGFPLAKKWVFFPHFPLFHSKPEKPQLSSVCGNTQNHIPVLVHRSSGNENLDKRVQLLFFNSLDHIPKA